LTIERVFDIVIRYREMNLPPRPIEVRVHVRDSRSNEDLTQGIDSAHARISSTQRELLRLIAEGDRRELWRNSGARDMAHWISIRHGISDWKARRWVVAAHALERLPRLSGGVHVGRARYGQGRRARSVRHSGDRSEARPVGQGGVMWVHPTES